jgi:hypothetical protein
MIALRDVSGEDEAVSFVRLDGIQSMWRFVSTCGLNKAKVGCFGFCILHGNITWSY